MTEPMKRFDIEPLNLSGLYLVRRCRLGDARGYFSRLFCAEELYEAGWRGAIAQINHTYTQHQGTIRGLHSQRPPHAETKLVSCIRGSVWDVAVDLRKGSPTFGQWQARELSAENGCALLIPSGFAHGFQTLTDNVEMLYCHSVPYVPQADAGLNARDSRLAIAWPLPIGVMSPRDAALPFLDDHFQGFPS